MTDTHTPSSFFRLRRPWRGRAEKEGRKGGEKEEGKGVGGEKRRGEGGKKGKKKKEKKKGKEGEGAAEKTAVVCVRQTKRH